MAELKPCPFCGGEAEYLIQSHSASGNDRGWMFGIRCKKCNVTTPKRNFELVARLCEDGQIHITKDERGEAADLWNGRADE